jgi:long-chain fatty acid adenylyltransferase FadD28
LTRSPDAPGADFAIPSVLRERASLAPNEPAFTFVDYAADPSGAKETLSWSQLYRRSCGVAQALSRSGSTGDRALIVAPQSLDYIVAFVGALQAGMVAVPLSVPQLGEHDERTSSVLADSTPTAVLTTSAVSAGMQPYLRAARPAPAVIEVDLLDRLAPSKFSRHDPDAEVAYLQYTSGSTRTPAGVMVSHRNLAANFGQVMRCYWGDSGGPGDTAPPDTTMVSWLPFYHDLGLWIGVSSPILAGLHSVVFSPMSFLMRPARWLQLMASYPKVFTPAPNFALELALRRITDKDIAGLDLSDVRHVISGAERVHASTLQRFADRFAPCGLRPEALCPSYGLAEATVYVAASPAATYPNVAHFDPEKLSAGVAERCAGGTDQGLVGYAVPESPLVRIVDPEARTELPAGTVGEIWAHGDNNAVGYWQRPDETERTFRASLVDPSAGTPEGPWLRTGDLGVLSEGELFIMGRIKDLLIIYGRNHYPDDIEATVGDITGGRVAAISVPGDQGEQLAVIAEVLPDGFSADEVAEEVEAVERAVISAVSTGHGVRVETFLPVPPGSLPLTTSGKVRRSTCVEMYRGGEFVRVDADEFDDPDSSDDEDDAFVDVEATISKVTDGLAAVISVPRDGTEEMVAIVELTTEQTGSADGPTPQLRAIKRDIMSALSTSHGLRVTDLVPVPPGSIPLTSGGGVRRSACVERYRNNEFKRLDVSANMLNDTW